MEQSIDQTQDCTRSTRHAMLCYATLRYAMSRNTLNADESPQSFSDCLVALPIVEHETNGSRLDNPAAIDTKVKEPLGFVGVELSTGRDRQNPGRLVLRH